MLFKDLSKIDHRQEAFIGTMPVHDALEAFNCPKDFRRACLDSRQLADCGVQGVHRSLACVREEAALLRAMHAAEQNEALTVEACRHEEGLRLLNETMIERTCRLSVTQLVVLREQCAHHRRELLRLTDEKLQAKIEHKLETSSDSRLVCNLTLALLKDPVLAADGLIYEKRSFEQWLAIEREKGRGPGKARSPVTNATLANSSLHPDEDLKQEIRDAVQAAKSAHANHLDRAREWIDRELKTLEEDDDIENMLIFMRHHTYTCMCVCVRECRE